MQFNESEIKSLELCLKNFFLENAERKVCNKFLKIGNSQTYFNNREEVKNLVRLAVELGFESGKRYGKEKIVYKDKLNGTIINDWEIDKVYPKGSVID